MKIIVCGKGGSGKSTLAVLLSKSLVKSGYNVLLIDADESNMGLHRLVGAEAPVVLLDDLGGKKGLKEKMASVFPGVPGGLSGGKLTPSQISDACVSEAGGIRLLKIGKIHSPGEGCACPMGRLSKMVFSGLSLGPDDVAIVDTTAGVEHFGRGLDAECDLVLSVVDPSYESFLLAEKVALMASEAGLMNYLILNKTAPEMEETISKHVDMTKVIGRVDYQEAVFSAGLEGRELDGDFTNDETIAGIVQEFKKNKHSG